MMLLPETERALKDIAANEQFMLGFHDGTEIQAGAIGRDVGEVVFDPELHDAGDINPLSVWEQVTGERHVDIAIPDRPLSLQVILHQRQGNHADFYDIQRAKRGLATDLHDIIGESLPGMTDMLRSYEVGEAAQQDAPPHVEVVATNGDPLVEAQTIAELCQGGLSIVISDFLALPLESQSPDNFPATVAIKANHPFDLALPANCGILPIGLDGGEVNTDKPKQLQPVNERMATAHHQTVNGLERIGIAVAQVVFNRREFPQFGFDTQRTDQQVARAFDAVNR